MTIVSCLCLSSLSPVSAADTCEYQSITGTYSTLQLHADTGDLLGIEITLVYSREGYRVVFQSSEGEPNAPIVARAEVKEGRLHFALPESSGYREFDGEITPCDITGGFAGGQLGPNGEKRFRLPKKSSYWQY